MTAATQSHQAIIGKSSREILEVSDALRFLAESAFDKAPGGLTTMLEMLADRTGAIGSALDSVKLKETAGGGQ